VQWLLQSFATEGVVAPWNVFATLGGITDGTCIYCRSDRSACIPTVKVSWTLSLRLPVFSCVVLVLVVVST
jgi:hypothetical protein